MALYLETSPMRALLLLGSTKTAAGGGAAAAFRCVPTCETEEFELGGTGAGEGETARRCSKGGAATSPGANLGRCCRAETDVNAGGEVSASLPASAVSRLPSAVHGMWPDNDAVACVS